MTTHKTTTAATETPGTANTPTFEITDGFPSREAGEEYLRNLKRFTQQLGKGEGEVVIRRVFEKRKDETPIHYDASFSRDGELVGLADAKTWDLLLDWLLTDSRVFGFKIKISRVYMFRNQRTKHWWVGYREGVVE